MKEKEERKAIFLPAILYKKIKERVNATEFNSVEEYVSFVLEEILKDEEEKTLNKEQEEEVKKRLKDLGYLD